MNCGNCGHHVNIHGSNGCCIYCNCNSFRLPTEADADPLDLERIKEAQAKKILNVLDTALTKYAGNTMTIRCSGARWYVGFMGDGYEGESLQDALAQIAQVMLSN
jgi:hypothetical protein